MADRNLCVELAFEVFDSIGNGWVTKNIKMSIYKENLGALTAQERKVSDRVAEAKTNKEIACDLQISPATVKRHLENILRKLQLRSRVEAAVYSVRMSNPPSEVTSPPGSAPASDRPSDPKTKQVILGKSFPFSNAGKVIT